MPRRATVRWAPRRRPGTKPGGGGGVPVRPADRLSDLPDALLHHVMSFLKAWEVVRTCVLSRRWRDLWASAPCLDLRVPCSRRDADPPEEFGRFVSRMLLSRDVSAPVDTLRLRSSDGDDYADTYDNDDVNVWIRFSIKHNARVIHLNGHRKDDLVLEHTAFVSRHLKILKLSFVELDGKVLMQLSSGCPSLEDLDLNNCSIKGREIMCSSLKKLTMVKCWITVDFTVCAPSLLFLRCITPYYRVPLLKNLGSLVSASITVDDDFLRNEEYLHVDEEFEETSNDDAEGNSSDNDSDDDDDYCDDDDFLHDFFYDGSDINSDDNTYEYSEIANDYITGKNVNDHDSYKQGGGYDEDSANHVVTNGKNFGGQNVLHSLSNATCLELLAHSGEVVLLRELKRCSSFGNLKTLSLGEWCMAGDLTALIFLLQHSAKLEMLFLKLELNYGNKEAVKVGLKAKGRSFACKNLAMVKIRCSKDDARVHMLATSSALMVYLLRRFMSGILAAPVNLRSTKELREICSDELREAGRWW
ncbi:hypothetical protein ACP70R_003347 [Stipagrostis hirtigluma subsp. patula]